VLPLQNALQQEHRGSYGWLLFVGMFIVASIYASFGLLGYFTFGAAAQVDDTALNTDTNPDYTTPARHHSRDTTLPPI
jgi:hypothetical protein